MVVKRLLSSIFLLLSLEKEKNTSKEKPVQSILTLFNSFPGIYYPIKTTRARGAFPAEILCRIMDCSYVKFYFI